MLAITIVVISFKTALLGAAHSHAAKPGQRSYKGLTQLGHIVVLSATLGMTFGCAKEIFGIRDAELRTALIDERTRLAER